MQLAALHQLTLTLLESSLMASNAKVSELRQLPAIAGRQLSACAGAAVTCHVMPGLASMYGIATPVVRSLYHATVTQVVPAAALT